MVLSLEAAATQDPQAMTALAYNALLLQHVVPDKNWAQLQEHILQAVKDNLEWFNLPTEEFLEHFKSYLEAAGAVSALNWDAAPQKFLSFRPAPRKISGAPRRETRSRNKCYSGTITR